jgi:hypothetical protein
MKHTIAHVVVANNPQLNVTKAYLSRSLASLEFDDSFESRIPTATGFVSSQEPSAKARLVLNLKDGPVSSQWSAQIQHNSIIGIVSAYVDVNGGRNFNLSDCAITHVESGHDGEPTIIIIDGTITKETASAGMNV